MSVLNFILQDKLKYKHLKLSEAYELVNYLQQHLYMIKHLREKKQLQPKEKLKDNVLIIFAVNKLPNSQTNVILQMQNIYVNHEIRL